MRKSLVIGNGSLGQSTATQIASRGVADCQDYHGVRFDGEDRNLETHDGEFQPNSLRISSATSSKGRVRPACQSSIPA